MEGAGWRVFVNGVQVDLVHQDVGIDAAGNVSHFAESGFGGQHTGGVVEIGEHDELGLAADGVPDFGRVERVAIGFEAGKAFYASLQVLGGGDQEFVGRVLDQDIRGSNTKPFVVTLTVGQLDQGATTPTTTAP